MTGYVKGVFNSLKSFFTSTSTSQPPDDDHGHHQHYYYQQQQENHQPLFSFLTTQQQQNHYQGGGQTRSSYFHQQQTTSSNNNNHNNFTSRFRLSEPLSNHSSSSLHWPYSFKTATTSSNSFSTGLNNCFGRKRSAGFAFSNSNTSTLRGGLDFETDDEVDNDDKDLVSPSAKRYLRSSTNHIKSITTTATTHNNNPFGHLGLQERLTTIMGSKPLMKFTTAPQYRKKPPPEPVIDVSDDSSDEDDDDDEVDELPPPSSGDKNKKEFGSSSSNNILQVVKQNHNNKPSLSSSNPGLKQSQQQQQPSSSSSALHNNKSRVPTFPRLFSTPKSSINHSNHHNNTTTRNLIFSSNNSRLSSAARAPSSFFPSKSTIQRQIPINKRNSSATSTTISSLDFYGGKSTTNNRSSHHVFGKKKPAAEVITIDEDEEEEENQVGTNVKENGSIIGNSNSNKVTPTVSLRLPVTTPNSLLFDKKVVTRSGTSSSEESSLAVGQLNGLPTTGYLGERIAAYRQQHPPSTFISSSNNKTAINGNGNGNSFKSSSSFDDPANNYSNNSSCIQSPTSSMSSEHGGLLERLNQHKTVLPNLINGNGNDESSNSSSRSGSSNHYDDLQILSEKIISPPRDPYAVNSLELETRPNEYRDRKWLVEKLKTYEENRTRRKSQIDYELKTLQVLKQESSIGKDICERIRRSLTITDVITLEPTPPVFPEITDEMNEIINRALKLRNDSEVLATAFNIQITRADLKTLLPCQWLNDNVINTYMDMIAHRSKNSPGSLPSVYVFTTFFYPKFQKEGYSNILKRWTRKVDIFSYDLLIFPIHLGIHWCLAAADLRKKQITFYDSLLGNHVITVKALLKYLASEMKERKKIELIPGEWKLDVPKDIPTQANGSDCGVFTCKFAEYLSRDAPLTFSQENMNYFRSRMVYEIIKQDLLYP